MSTSAVGIGVGLIIAVLAIIWLRRRPRGPLHRVPVPDHHRLDKRAAHYFASGALPRWDP